MTRTCHRLLWLWLVAQLLVPAFMPRGACQVTAGELRQKIALLAAEVRAAQRSDGSFRGNGGNWPIGQTSFAVLALRAAGVPADDAGIVRAVEFLVSREPGESQGVYETSLKIMALQSVDPVRHLDGISAGALYLIEAQQGSGGWSYGRSGSTDNSNSQFAILGLHAAAMAGAKIPDAVWQAAHNYFSAGQNADGGWAYRVRSGSSYGSMTAAGVASLYVCDLWLHVSRGQCGVYADARRVQAGLQWLARNFSVTRNPNKDSWKFYYLYGLERAGTILARRYIGPHDWYREGVEHLVGDPEQMVLAPVRNEWKYLQQCYMLLFLAKGNAPLLIQKAEWPGAWSSYRYDLRFLTQRVGQELGQSLDWQIVPLEAPLDQLMGAPILYLSGRGTFQWTAEQIGRLQDYIQAGGFVLVESAGGDLVFDRVFRGFVREHLSDYSLEALPADHPIYSCYFHIPVGERPRLEAVKGPCWISVLYAPRGLSCPWDVADWEHVNFKLGTNIAAYVTGLEDLQGKLVEPVYYTPARREPEVRRGAFTLGQVVHGGDWQPHKTAWRKVLELANQKAGLQVYSRPLPIRVDVESPFQAHMLYLTGVQELALSADARDALKRYVERGGFIFAEAACGSARFDRSFRELMAAMFPEQELSPLPVGHALYEIGEPIGHVVYSRAVREAEPGLERPVLEHIEVDGRAVIVYSKYDLSSAIDGHPCHTCPSILEPSASRLAIKILLYGLSS